MEIIRAQIRASGPVSFAWFMEQALYHAAYGYYSSGRAAIGRGGDYFTNVSVGPVLGRLMAVQFAEMWNALGRPAEFTIVEQGAHGGEFAHDVLVAAQERHREFFAALRYVIVEPFAALGARQRELLAAFLDNVQWCDSLDALAPFSGVHFSNELFDSLPMHIVRWNGAEWVDRCVDVAPSGFAFVDARIENDRLFAQLANIARPVGDYETEVNLAAPAMIEQVAAKLERGFVVAVDYGFPRTEFYAAHRTTGTLQSYAAHRVIPSPLANIGEADITAHVEWTSIAEAAEASGLTVSGFTDQHHFITGLLASTAGAELVESADAAMQRQLQTLLHPAMLGMKFQFLVLAKGVETSSSLAGLRFARDSRNALELSD